MQMTFDAARPIYAQIVSGLERAICSGELLSGQRVPPVRELAAELRVNPNTLQRALSEMERNGLMYTERTSGRYVTQDADRIGRLRNTLAEEMTSAYLRDMAALGYKQDAVLQKLTGIGKEIK